jgi:fructosamine-3-kinase
MIDRGCGGWQRNAICHGLFDAIATIPKSSAMWDAIEAQIQSVTGVSFTTRDRRSVSGGSINQASCISDGRQSYFVKLNSANQVIMFEAEAFGLQDLAASGSIRVPRPICWGTTKNNSYIVLEWIDLGRGTPSSWVELGRQLAHLHRGTHSKGFGWDRNNTIGSTPQLNPWTQDWADFFIEHRIGYQIQLAQRRGASFAQTDRLLRAIANLLSHRPVPSLVHGDLWSGNAGFSTISEPVIFDPAVYWGDREVDIAMTELFGKFPQGFYTGYRDEWPLDEGYELRKRVYNLYHILNHFNLFGGSYYAQAEQMMAQIIR